MFGRNSKLDGLDRAIRREFVRLILERVQGAGIEEAMGDAKYSPDDLPAGQYEVTDYLNRPYMNKDEVALAMDVFVPQADEERDWPVIVNIHGGGLVLGDRKISRVYGHMLASRGYIVFNIEYRLAPRANVSEQLDDVCAGMDAIALHLVEFNVDFNRIFLTADSAGAYLAIYTATMKYSKHLQEVIGYTPTRMEIRALGLVSGMFYTTLNDPLGFLLADQFYGSKRPRAEFMGLLNPEHPEIVNNLPPTFLVTSRGDFLNNYSIMFHNALKAAGRTSKLVYYGDAELGHTFMCADPTHPKSVDAIDRMLAWFEEQADARVRRIHATQEQQEQVALVEQRMESHEIIEQKSWQFIRELNSATEERLDMVALRDNRRTYTFRQMFRKWEHFAEVFSALGIGEAAASRVGLLGTCALEPIFAFYGLNMVGAQVSMLSALELVDLQGFFRAVEGEGVTDLIMSDIFASPGFVTRVLAERDRLGLRHVIVLKSPYGGRLGNEAIEAMSVQNYRALKGTQGLLFMDELLRTYEATPIAFATSTNDDAAVVVHTSGITNGIHKPIPLSDRGLNEGAYRIMRCEAAASVRPGDVCLLYLDLSSAYALVDMLHMPLAFGARVATVPFGIANPQMSRAFGLYGVNYMMFGPATLEMMAKEPARPNLSSVRMPFCGGEYLSAERRARLNEFLHACGCKADLTCGYGLSEAAGALIVSGAERTDDAIGYPLPGVKVRLLDEDDGTYHELLEGPRRGVLCVSSPSVSSGRLGDTEYFSVEEESGERWLNTYDLVDVNEDGSLTYVGRMNKFFVNHAGVRFDAGLVECAMERQPGIVAASLAGEYDKIIHDTVPVLYVTCTTQGAPAVRTVRDALVAAFVREDAISKTNLPGQCVICADIPRTPTGKVDVLPIMNGQVRGERYQVLPTYAGDRLVDVHLRQATHVPGTWAGLPAELNPWRRLMMPHA